MEPICANCRYVSKGRVDELYLCKHPTSVLSKPGPIAGVGRYKKRELLNSEYQCRFFEGRA